MANATQTYEAVSFQTASPRKVEANLLLKAASRLQAVHDSWDSNRGELDEALFFNRRLWSLLVAAVTNSGNPLPTNIRQNVANIGIFVLKHTMASMADPKPENLGSLIKINREIAAGLMSRAA
jgi:flagellar biosynthesis activator protein FlaF